MASHIGAPSNKRNYHKVGAMNFEQDLFNAIKSYTDDVKNAIVDDVVDTAKFGCELLQKTQQPDASKSGSAKPMKRREWKRYAGSWVVEMKGGKDSNFIHCIIRNKKHYRLTHLLEYGHATRDGNRTREFRHIEPVEKYCTEHLEKSIPKIIEKGGKYE